MPTSPRPKYQFSIFEYNRATNNSAATKAVADCITLFTRHGYQNRILTFDNNLKRGLKFYSAAFVGICKFLLTVESGALVGVQYPMLNKVFKYFIVAARLKKINFFCVIHDIETLRTGGGDAAAVKAELTNLNFYKCLIVHNDRMKQWLLNNGIQTKMVCLQLFDYLAEQPPVPNRSGFSHRVVYAGNLGKSKFVLQLHTIRGWDFRLYGPNYQPENDSPNVHWCGEFSPAEVVDNLEGDFGLIWDGDRIDRMDNVLGNYLKFNNPHKFSLYLAAGLPVIVPATAAIAVIVTQYKIGLLINNLNDLNTINVSLQNYQMMRQNVAGLQAKVTSGAYFSRALDAVEKQLQD